MRASATTEMTLVGGAGDDTLVGGTGQDALYGHTSADRQQADGIVDFSQGERDRIADAVIGLIGSPSLTASDFILG